MKKEYYLDVNQETIDYLQRLGMEYESYLAVIDRLFDSHKKDNDTSLFDSIPWRKYYKEYEMKKAEYELAKNEYENFLKKIVSEKENNSDVIFDWHIEDFNINKVKITILN